MVKTPSVAQFWMYDPDESLIRPSSPCLPACRLAGGDLGLGGSGTASSWLTDRRRNRRG
jgi:hypothetical protein